MTFKRRNRPAITLSCFTLVLIALSCQGNAQVREELRKGDETTTFKALQSTVSPYETVTLQLDFEKGRADVTPDPAVIWYESKNPISQLLWTVRCVAVSEGGHDEVTCPREVTVTIRAKQGCSATLFGAEEITIREGHNAIPSGLPNGDELRELFRRQEKSDRFCNGLLKKDHPLMPMRESVHDYYWAYEVIVRRGGEEIFRKDPVVWLEQDN